MNQTQYLENLLRVTDVLSDSRDLDATLSRLMQELLDIYKSDRAWLLYPCDPNSESWTVPVEATSPDFPGAFVTGEHINTDEGSKAIFNDSLAAKHPVTYEFSNPESAPEEIRKFQIKSQMVIALEPRDDKAWMLGMHQCTHVRKWSDEEKRLFSDISLKVKDMLTQRLLLKRLEDELKLRKEAQQELVIAKEKAESASRAKTRFLSIMSHELRTPMNAIMGFAQLLNMDDLSEEQKTNVFEILHAGEHLLGLIEEILDLSQIESGKLSIELSDNCLNSILDECLRLTNLLAESRNIEIMDSINRQENVYVCTDRTRIKQVLINLISNGIKYNKEGGSLTLASHLEAPDFVRIEVTDTGIGMTNDEVKQLFKPFVRLKRHGNTEGSGIGLAVSKGLIEMMGGDIGVESRLNEGSTFWIRLRLSDRSQERQ